LSRNLEALTSWNPLGLSRPVMGLLYLFISNMDPSSIAPHDVESGYGHVLRHLPAFACNAEKWTRI
jgi:hypothetical protein